MFIAVIFPDMSEFDKQAIIDCCAKKGKGVYLYYVDKTIMDKPFTEYNEDITYKLKQEGTLTPVKGVVIDSIIRLNYDEILESTWADESFTTYIQACVEGVKWPVFFENTPFFNSNSIYQSYSNIRWILNNKCGDDEELFTSLCSSFQKYIGDWYTRIYFDYNKTYKSVEKQIIHEKKRTDSIRKSLANIKNINGGKIPKTKYKTKAGTKILKYLVQCYEKKQGFPKYDELPDEYHVAKATYYKYLKQARLDTKSYMNYGDVKNTHCPKK